jgi:PKD repeat protein
MKRFLLQLVLSLALFCGLNAQTTVNTANFTWVSTGLNVQFTNTSDPLTGYHYQWSFGDGTSSDLVHPPHSYQQPGTYTVCLKKINPNNVTTDSICKQVSLTVNTYCQVDFRDSSVGPLSKKFFPLLAVNTSASVQFKWSFGDGTYSTDASPTHQYAQAGTYNVCLRVQYSNGCIAEKCHTITIPLVCAIQFRDSTTGPLTKKFFPLFAAGVSDANAQFTWNFGDGATSHDRTPVHQYANAGTYTVCLRVVYSNGCVAEICRQIIVEAVCQTDFRDSTVGPLTKKFFPLLPAISTTGIQITWAFGEGTFSNDITPVHTYAQPGTYNVCLRVQYANGCVAYKCRTITIPPPPVCEAGFRDSLIGPFTVHFWSLITSNAATSYQWNFGDGTGSTDPNPVHQFPHAGTYRVCLRVQYANGCVAYKCKDIVVPGPTPTNCEVGFNDSVAGPYTLKFWPRTIQNYYVVSYLWNFGDGGSSTEPRPTHTYRTAGSYNVCLTVKYALPGSTTAICEARICKIVIVRGAGCGAIINDSIAGLLKVQFWSILPRNDVQTLVWSFGDGTTSTLRNPLHQYQHGGRYRVCLDVKYVYDNCEAHVCKDVVLADEPCKDSFRVEPYFGPNNTGLTYQFFSIVNRNDAILYQWSFGDGTFSLQKDPIKSYLQPGAYNVCLRVSFANGCVANYCSMVKIERVCRVEIQDSLIRPRTYKFSVRSSRPGIVQYNWNFGDGTTSTAASPEHTFANNGNYHICVRTLFADGCLTYDCDDLNVFRIATGTNIEVSTYPNPAENQITFRLENTTVASAGTITIYTSAGTVVKKESVSGGSSFTVNITELKGGSYIAEIRIGSQVARKNFVKLQ